MTHKIVNLQVVAFDDFKRLSTGTSLAEVKVQNFMFTMTSLDSSFFRLLESGVRKERVTKCRMV